MSSLFPLLSFFIRDVALVKEHEIGNDNGHRQCQAQDARQGAHGAHNFPLDSHWVHVTVPDSSHCYNSPPKCIRYTFEVRRFPSIRVGILCKNQMIGFKGE